MIEGIFDFDEILVKEIMTPRIDIVSIHQNDTIKEAFEITAETGFSRLPVTGESLDEIKGIVHVRDLVSHMVEGSKDSSIKDTIRKPYFIPESKKALDLLEEFQKNSIHMAIVINEYGGTEGLITMEDLLEEIVGDIKDEHDMEENEITKMNKTHVTVRGDTDIQDINDRLNLNIPDLEKYETIAGFILYRLNRIPDPGEKFEYDKSIFTITEMKGQRITQVKISRKDQIKQKKG
jgi:CBS domain containing-hemolysin-like protein